MSDITFRITGDNSAAVLSAMRMQSLRALEMCGLLAERYAVQNITEAPAVDTGMLRNSISHKLVNDESAVYVGTNIEYAPYVEFGTGKYTPGGRQTSWVYEDRNGNWHRTSGMKPRPYLKPAIADHAQEYKNLIIDELKN